MWELKALFDPDNVLNPGVVLNRDPDLHVKNLKPSPVASPLVDRCIECGFCESNCPSRDGALTPRQRITSFREISRLKGLVAEGTASSADSARLTELEGAYEYAGKEMCAADGMCQEKCPVKINTGDLIKELRAGDVAAAPRAAAFAGKLADSMGAVTAAVPPFLNAVDLARRVVGAGTLASISGALNRWSGRVVPTYNAYMPKGAPRLPAELKAVSEAGPTPSPPRGSVTPRRAVYLPSCVTRMMGPAGTDPQGASAAPADRLVSLAAKAGWEVVTPDGLSGLCCGMMFGSKGFSEAANKAAARTIAALEAASEGGRLPIVCDTSPCTATLKAALPAGSPLRFAMHEPVGFVSTHLAPGLEFEKVAGRVAVHVPCSSKKMGATAAFEGLVAKCADEVVPSGVPCCGMAGDRGMRYPELTGGSLQHLNSAGCEAGVSTSRTCEMSLSNHSGLHWRGVLDLVDRAARPKGAGASESDAEAAA
jgi:D-lactate dehydrogenase